MSTGCQLAQRLTDALLGFGIPYQRMATLVYDALSTIADEQAEEDWLVFPNGTTYTLTFKPSSATPCHHHETVEVRDERDGRWRLICRTCYEDQGPV